MRRKVAHVAWQLLVGDRRVRPEPLRPNSRGIRRKRSAPRKEPVATVDLRDSRSDKDVAVIKKELVDRSSATDPRGTFPDGFDSLFFGIDKPNKGATLRPTFGVTCNHDVSATSPIFGEILLSALPSLVAHDDGNVADRLPKMFNVGGVLPMNPTFVPNAPAGAMGVDRSKRNHFFRSNLLTIPETSVLLVSSGDL